MSLTRTIYRDKAVIPDTEEYLNVTVTCSTEGVDLDAQPVYITFDRAIYYTAEWVGDVGPTRTARLLMDDSNLPTGKTSTIYVRVTDNPEAPIIAAGKLNVL